MKDSNLRKEIWVYQENLEDITLFNKPDILVSREPEGKIRYILASDYQEEVDIIKYGPPRLTKDNIREGLCIIRIDATEEDDVWYIRKLKRGYTRETILSSPIPFPESDWSNWEILI